MNHEDEINHEEHAAVDAMVPEDREAQYAPLLSTTPWHGCLISFIVHRSALERCPDLSIHPKLPKCWELYCATPKGLNYAKIEFSVEGDVKREDGRTVKGIMEELGIL